MAFFLIRKFKIDASYVNNPLYCLISDHTWTTIFLGTDPPNLPMMLSNSSKLILPSMSLSAYASVLMMAIFYSRGIYPTKVNSPVDHAVQLLLLQVVAHHHLQHLRSQNWNHFIEEFAFRHREEFLPRYEAIAVNVIDLESEPEVSIALRWI